MRAKALNTLLYRLTDLIDEFNDDWGEQVEEVELTVGWQYGYALIDEFRIRSKGSEPEESP